MWVFIEYLLNYFHILYKNYVKDSFQVCVKSDWCLGKSGQYNVICLAMFIQLPFILDDIEFAKLIWLDVYTGYRAYA